MKLSYQIHLLAAFLGLAVKQEMLQNVGLCSNGQNGKYCLEREILKTSFWPETFLKLSERLWWPPSMHSVRRRWFVLEGETGGRTWSTLASARCWGLPSKSLSVSRKAWNDWSGSPDCWHSRWPRPRWSCPRRGWRRWRPRPPLPSWRRALGLKEGKKYRPESWHHLSWGSDFTSPDFFSSLTLFLLGILLLTESWRSSV